MGTIIKFITLVLDLIYGMLKLLPQHHKIVIISRQSNTPSLDITMLKLKFNELHPEYKVIVLCKKIEAGFFNKISYCFHILTQMYHLATSEIVILDSYCIAVSLLTHRKNLLIIQMWHSIGTMKKFAYSILDKPEGSSSKIAHLMKMHKNYDYILASGDGYRTHLADGFNYPLEKIVTLPLPRVEILKDKKYAHNVKEKIYQVYPDLKKKDNIVYVPTFRKANDNEFLEALSTLSENIDYSKYNLIIKTHPLTNLSNFHSKYAIVDKTFSSFDMLFIADYVVSDYSCIIYEAAALNKPTYLYTYDYDKYMSTRDIYIDYKAEVPGPICSDAKKLLKVIENKQYDYDKLHKFLNKYVYMKGEHETEDIVNFLFNLKI